MFSHPLYLFALAGLVVPVAIHLLSRKEGKVIKLGSVRHVVETSTQQFKGIKLNELLLLALRCAMVVVFSILLSGLQCASRGSEKWVVVEKGLADTQNLHSILDSLENNEYSLHFMASGLPALKDSSTSPEISYWQLAEELKQKNLEDVIVFSKNNINRFKGMRIPLPENIRWLSQPAPPVDLPIRAVRISSDSVTLLTGHFTPGMTKFTSKTISIDTSPIAITPQDTIKIILVSDSEFKDDRKVITAALLAIEKMLFIKIKLVETDPSLASANTADWCIWLSSKKAIGINSKKFILIDASDANELIEPLGLNQWVITKRLQQGVALRNNLTTQLATLLLTNEGLEDKISSSDIRMVSDSLAWDDTKANQKISTSIQYVSADNYLIILLLILLIIERILAYQKNQ